MASSTGMYSRQNTTLLSILVFFLMKNKGENTNGIALRGAKEATKEEQFELYSIYGLSLMISSMYKTSLYSLSLA